MCGAQVRQRAGPGLLGEPGEASRGRGRGWDHGGGPKRTLWLEADPSFMQVMGQDLCGPSGPTQPHATSPTSPPAPPPLLSLHLSGSDLLSDSPVLHAGFFLKSCVLGAPSAWHAVAARTSHGWLLPITQVSGEMLRIPSSERFSIENCLVPPTPTPPRSLPHHTGL